MSENKPKIYDCTKCGKAVYYPDTHERDCPFYGTRRGKP